MVSHRVGAYSGQSDHIILAQELEQRPLGFRDERHIGGAMQTTDVQERLCRLIGAHVDERWHYEYVNDR